MNPTSPDGSTNPAMNPGPNPWKDQELTDATVRSLYDFWCQELLTKALERLCPILGGCGFLHGQPVQGGVRVSKIGSKREVSAMQWLQVIDIQTARTKLALQARTYFRCEMVHGAPVPGQWSRPVQLTCYFSVQFGYIDEDGPQDADFVTEGEGAIGPWSANLAAEGIQMRVTNVDEVGRWLNKQFARSLEPDVFDGDGREMGWPERPAGWPVPLTLDGVLHELVNRVLHDQAP